MFNLPLTEILRFWLLDSEGTNDIKLSPYLASLVGFCVRGCDTAVSLIIRGKHFSEAIGGLTSWECWFLLLQFGLKWEKTDVYSCWLSLVPPGTICGRHRAQCLCQSQSFYLMIQSLQSVEVTLFLILIKAFIPLLPPSCS